MNDYNFGNFLYALRTKKGLSQAQLGEMLGVTNKAVSKWENGTTKPNTYLIPQIAKIFGITVEELFACKKIEEDSEHQIFKQFLLLQRRKYAILSSIFLAIICTIPLFLIEFICIVMGFNLNDDVLGPLGAICFICAFIISITAYFICRDILKKTIIPTESVYSARFVKCIKSALILSATTFFCVLILLILVSFFSSNNHPLNIFVSVVAAFLILILGVFICFLNIKQLLKIKFISQSKKENKKIQFSKLPIWAKICYIMIFIPFPLSIIYSNNTCAPIKILNLIIKIICFTLVTVITIYNLRKKH